LGYKLAKTQGALTPMQIDFLKRGYEKLLAARSGAQISQGSSGSAVERYRGKRRLYDYPAVV